ncbi:MAG TPA: hypothetical protein VFP50_16820 [Anaeromyxobacteraceae bacterium]|nr:hypothetical protein [Anaeromyxobacteraceae bacterium]
MESSGPRSRTVDGRAELDALLACLGRAERIESQRESGRWTHRIDIFGDAPGHGRWLYDATSGDLRYLTVKVSPTYRLSAADKSRAEELMLPR